MRSWVEFLLRSRNEIWDFIKKILYDFKIDEKMYSTHLRSPEDHYWGTGPG